MKHLHALALALLALATLALALPARAIDLDLCDDDGVTEIPDFAIGRDANGCLMIPTGNGDPDVPFQFEVFHQAALSGSSIDSGEPEDGLIPFFRADCRASDDGSKPPCTSIYWDVTIDGYSSEHSKNDDLMFIGDRYGAQTVLIKDSVIANTFACKGGQAFEGPNGLSCAAGEYSGAHVDGLQLRGSPVRDGWFVMQDTKFVNGFNLHMLVQADAFVAPGNSQSFEGPLGGLVIQGGLFGRAQSAGLASTWIDDCELVRDGNPNGDDICPLGRAQIGSPIREAWFIDMDPAGVTRINAFGPREKIVVVSTATPEYANGWPYPLAGLESMSGNGTCPDGPIVFFQGIPTFCYRSLEAAQQDHKLPPFVQLSAAGWAAGATPDPVSTAEPLPEPEPAEPMAAEEPSDPEPTPDPEPTVEPAPTSASDQVCSIVITRSVPCEELD